MRNRAKCRLCGTTLESFHRHDYVTCKCGEIALDGGNEIWKCAARDFSNFIRLDDEDNEIAVKVIESKEELYSEPPDGAKLSKIDLLNMLDEMRRNIENLQDRALLEPITHYDFASLLLLISSIFRADDSEDRDD